MTIAREQSQGRVKLQTTSAMGRDRLSLRMSRAPVPWLPEPLSPVCPESLYPVPCLPRSPACPESRSPVSCLPRSPACPEPRSLVPCLHQSPACLEPRSPACSEPRSPVPCLLRYSSLLASPRSPLSEYYVRLNVSISKKGCNLLMVHRVHWVWSAFIIYFLYWCPSLHKNWGYWEGISPSPNHRVGDQYHRLRDIHSPWW